MEWNVSKAVNRFVLHITTADADAVATDAHTEPKQEHT